MVLRKPLKLKFSHIELLKEINDIHIAYIDNCYIMLGCLFLREINHSTTQLKQMAVRPDQQKRGYGSLIVNEAENTSRMEGYKKIVLHAREKAIGFYVKLGYEIVGDRFLEIGIPHYKMEKSIIF